MSETNTVSPLRQRMIEDMAARKLNPNTQRNHIQSCKRFAAWLKRSPTRQRPTRCADFVPPAADPQEQPDIATDTPRVLRCPCPRCGGRMVVIEVFARGCEPRWRPMPGRIDTS
jgi:hypothetical protein